MKYQFLLTNDIDEFKLKDSYLFSLRMCIMFLFFCFYENLIYFFTDLSIQLIGLMKRKEIIGISNEKKKNELLC